MADILVNISADQSISNHITQKEIDGFQIISTRELAWQDSPRFGLEEGILIIAAIKGLAELGKVIIEIIQELKKSQKSESTVQIELINGSNLTIRRDSDPQELTKKIAKSLDIGQSDDDTKSIR